MIGTYTGSCERDAAALVVEARKRGVSYGKLVSSTTGKEQREIIREYWEQKRARRKAKGANGK